MTHTKTLKTKKSKNNTTVYEKQRIERWSVINKDLKEYLKNRIYKMIEIGSPKVVIDSEINENFTLDEIYETFKFFYGDSNVPLKQMKDDYNNRKTYIEHKEIDGFPYYRSHQNPYMIYKLKKELVKEGYYKQFNNK